MSDQDGIKADATKVVEATAWKSVDDRKVEVSAQEWDAAVRVARAWLAEHPEGGE